MSESAAFSSANFADDIAPSSGRCNLPNLSPIHFGGADAVDFLQGQFTADIRALADGKWRFAAYCTPKGRMLANFIIWQNGDDFFALTQSDVAAGIVKRLKMYVLRAKVEITESPAKIAAVFSPMESKSQGDSSHSDGITLLSESKNRHLAVWEKDELPGEFSSLPPIDSAWWTLRQIADGIPWIAAGGQELFIPQMLNFELLGGVDFQKGCYVGQEIIARMHYRGQVKRRMFRAMGKGIPPIPGAAVFSRKFGEQAAGNVVNASPIPSVDGIFAALISCRLDAVAVGEGEADGLLIDAADAASGRKIKIFSPPYSLDDEKNSP